MDELDLLKQKAEAYDDLHAQLAAIRAERDEAVRLLKELLYANENLSGNALNEISEFLEKVQS